MQRFFPIFCLRQLLKSDVSTQSRKQHPPANSHALAPRQERVHLSPTEAQAALTRHTSQHHVRPDRPVRRHAVVRAPRGEFDKEEEEEEKEKEEKEKKSNNETVFIGIDVVVLASSDDATHVEVSSIPRRTHDCDWMR